MKTFKRIILILALMFMFSWTSFALSEAEEECVDTTDIDIWSNSVIRSLSEEDRLLFVYCLVDEINDNVNAESEKELIEDGEQEDIDLASSEELKLLLKKKNLLNQDWKELSYSEKKKIVELRSGLNCSWKIKPGETNNIITCIKDPRKQAFKEYQKDDSTLWAMWRWVDNFWTGLVNGILFAFSEFVSNSSFGYSKFDELPDLPYENLGWMFDTTTLYWLINSFALAVLGFIILYHFFKVWALRGWDDHKLFLLKVWFTILFIVLFPFLYWGLQSVLMSFETSLIDATSGLSSLDQTNVVEWIRMDVFNLWALTSITLWTVLFFIPNVLLLLWISLIIYIRDMFLLVLLNVFFLSAVWFLWGTLKKENIFEWNTVSAKMTKFSVYAMFWIIALFITVVITIFIFKFITVIWATIPSIETNGVSFVWNLSNFSIDAFVYLLSLILIIFFGKKTLLKSVFNGVSNFLTWIFFPWSQGLSWYSDMVTNVKDSYADIKMERDNLVENNPIFKSVTNTVSPLVDKTTELAQKSEFITNSSSILNEKQQKIRETLKPLKNTAKKVISFASAWYVQNRGDLSKVMKAWITATTWIWETHVTQLWNIDEARSDFKRELRRREESLNKLDENDPNNSKEIKKIKTRIKNINIELLKLDEEEFKISWTETDKVRYTHDKNLKKLEDDQKTTQEEIDEKKKEINQNKEDLSKLDLDKDNNLVKDIKDKNMLLWEEVKNLEKTKIVQKNLKSIEEEIKQKEIDNIENRDIWDIIKIPDILKKSENKSDKKQKDKEEELIVEDGNKNISEDSSGSETDSNSTKNNVDFWVLNKAEPSKYQKLSEDVMGKISFGKKKYEMREQVEDFISKSRAYQNNFDEKIFAWNTIFNYLYNKEVKRAWWEEFIDLDYINNDITYMLELLSFAKNEN